MSRKRTLNNHLCCAFHSFSSKSKLGSLFLPQWASLVSVFFLVRWLPVGRPWVGTSAQWQWLQGRITSSLGVQVALSPALQPASLLGPSPAWRLHLMGTGCWGVTDQRRARESYFRFSSKPLTGRENHLKMYFKNLKIKNRKPNDSQN